MLIAARWREKLRLKLRTLKAILLLVRAKVADLIKLWPWQARAIHPWEIKNNIEHKFVPHERVHKADIDNGRNDKDEPESGVLGCVLSFNLCKLVDVILPKAKEESVVLKALGQDDVIETKCAQRKGITLENFTTDIVESNKPYNLKLTPLSKTSFAKQSTAILQRKCPQKLFHTNVRCEDGKFVLLLGCALISFGYVLVSKRLRSQQVELRWVALPSFRWRNYSASR